MEGASNDKLRQYHLAAQEADAKAKQAHEACAEAWAETVQLRQMLADGHKRENEVSKATLQIESDMVALVAAKDNEIEKEKTVAEEAKRSEQEARQETQKHQEAAQAHMVTAMQCRAELVKQTREIEQTAAKLKSEKSELEAEKIQFSEHNACIKKESVDARNENKALRAEYEDKVNTLVKNEVDQDIALKQAIEESAKWKVMFDEADSKLARTSQEAQDFGYEEGKKVMQLEAEKDLLENECKYLADYAALKKDLEEEKKRSAYYKEHYERQSSKPETQTAVNDTSDSTNSGVDDVDDFDNSNDRKEEKQVSTVKNEVNSAMDTSEASAVVDNAAKEIEEAAKEVEAATKEVEEAHRKKREVELRRKAEQESRLKVEDLLKEVERASKEVEKVAKEVKKSESVASTAPCSSPCGDKDARVQEEEEDARVQEEEDARVQAEENARIQVEENARIKAEEEVRTKAKEDARIKAEEEAQLKAQIEEQEIQRLEEEMKLEADSKARIKAETEARWKAEKEKTAADEAKKKEQSDVKAAEQKKAKQAKEAEKARLKVEAAERQKLLEKAELAAKRKAAEIGQTGDCGVSDSVEEIARKTRARCANLWKESEDAKLKAEKERIEKDLRLKAQREEALEAQKRAKAEKDAVEAKLKAETVGAMQGESAEALRRSPLKKQEKPLHETRPHVKISSDHNTSPKINLKRRATLREQVMNRREQLASSGSNDASSHAANAPRAETARLKESEPIRMNREPHFNKEPPLRRPSTSKAGLSASEEERWDRFVSKASSGVKLRFEDVPFLSAVSIEAMKLKVSGHKKMFFVLARRWHPDKFLQAFGAQLHPDDMERVKDRVKTSFQDIQDKLKWK